MSIRLRTLVLSALISASFVLASPALAQAPAQAVAPAANLPQAQEMFMTTRDGVKLAANVFLPKGAGPFPVVLSRTPYLKDAGNPAQAAKKYVDAGYAYVVQDVRGKGHSQGFYQAFVTDIEDGYDTVEWVAKQPWSTGKTGMVGASALGITTNMAALSAPPHLTAAYVIVAPYDSILNTYPGGVLKDADTLGWLKGQGVAEDTLNTTRAGAANSAIANARALTVQRKFINIPMYNHGGWYDIFNDGNVENFRWLQNFGSKGARGNQKLYMAAAGHGGLGGAASGVDYQQPGVAAPGSEEMRWWDYWLKGVDNGIMDEPPVTFFMMAAGEKGKPASPYARVMKTANWPPAPRTVNYYLTADMHLTTRQPTVAAASKSYRFDPKAPVKTYGGANLLQTAGPLDQRPIGQRQDYLRFETPVLAKPTAIAGHVDVDLWAATDGPDTDFMAKLVDVYPDGYEQIILDAPIRTRFRNGRDPDDVTLMTPSKPEKLHIDMWNTAYTFEPGHKIQVSITSSNSTKFDVNPNTGEPIGAPPKLAPRVATNTIYFDKDHPSAIVLPVIYPDDMK